MDAALRAHHRNLSSDDLKKLLALYRGMAQDVMDIAGQGAFDSTHEYIDDVLDVLGERGEL